jgi:hypothetical protein
MTTIELELEAAVFKPELKGKLVRPTLGLDDRSFVYIQSLNTDLAETFRKAREGLGERKRERVNGLDS